MLKKWLAVGTIVLVLVFHVPAVFFDWYFYFWWYDVVMHALGGMAMGFLALWFWEALRQEEGIVTFRDLAISLVFVVGFVALIGIGWEWFEGLVDAFLVPRIGIANAQLGLADTMFDLYFDVFGGFFSWLLFCTYAEHRS